MLNSFLKILFLILIGYFFAFFQKNKKEEALNFLNKYLYFLGLPAIIILKTSNIEINHLNFNFLIVNSLPFIIVYFFIFIFWKIKIFSMNLARTLIIISVLGNTVYMGFPAISAFINESAIGYGAIISSIHNLMVFIFGIFLLNFIHEDEFNIKTFLKHILKNPVLISSIFAIFLVFMNFNFNSLIEDILSEISKTVIPLALLSLGLSLYGRINIFKRFKELVLISSIKLLILPFISFLTIYFLNDFNESIKASFIEYTMPIAVMGYILARELILDEELTSQSIALTTILYFPLIILYNYAIKILF